MLMSLDTSNVRIREFSGYLARPSRATGPLPGVVVIQEAWGLNPHIEDVTRRFAQAGYVALAPDCFARDGVRPPLLDRPRLAEAQEFLNELPPGTAMNAEIRDAALAKRPADEAARIRETITALFGQALGNTEENLKPVLAAIHHLRAHGSAAVVTVGFCMGGSLSALAACRDRELSGAVIFYGGAPPENEMDKLACPLVAFHGSLDQRLMGTLPAFEKAMREKGKSLELHVFEGAQHAFFNDTRPSYDVVAARKSFARTLQFFADVTG
jgi:carboxymethylenebutenolidase